ncbi:MAG: hypothetical protein ACOCRX_00935 [Candidatus Woesearchaeota archaeon]
MSNINWSYDYEDLISEIKGDVEEGLVEPHDLLKIVRAKDNVCSGVNYLPIIDYYYPDNFPNEKYEIMTVAAVLEEMKFHNKIL